MDYDRLLNLTTDLGYQLMASGAEIYRVEESMHRVLNAGGVCHPELYHRQRDYAPGASYHPDAAHPGPWDRH